MGTIGACEEWRAAGITVEVEPEGATTTEGAIVAMGVGAVAAIGAGAAVGTGAAVVVGIGAGATVAVA